MITSTSVRTTTNAAQNQKNTRRVLFPLIPRAARPSSKQENSPAVSVIVSRSSVKERGRNLSISRESSPLKILINGVISRGRIAMEYSFFPERKNTNDIASKTRTIAQHAKSIPPESAGPSPPTCDAIKEKNCKGFAPLRVITAPSRQQNIKNTCIMVNNRM